VQTSQIAGAVRVLETPRAMLVRVPLGLERPCGFRVMTRDDTLLIAGDGRVESIRLPRPASRRGLTARQDGDALYVRVPLELGIRASWTQSGENAKPASAPVGSVREDAARAVTNAALYETIGLLGY
jgi:hypothetical protein